MSSKISPTAAQNRRHLWPGPQGGTRGNVSEAARRHPQTVGIYNAGGANRGVIAAMEDGILPRRPLLIGHELTGFTYRCLKDGLMTLTIDQSPELQAQYAMEVVMHHFGFEGAVHAVPPYVSDAPFVLYGPQNLPTASPAERSGVSRSD